MTVALGRAARVTLQQQRPGGDAWFDRGYNAIAIDGLRVAFSSAAKPGARPPPTTIKVYNLAERTRADLQALPIAVLLEAGYASDAPRRVASGDLRSARTVSEGPSVVTTLEISDGYRAWSGATLDRGYRPGAPIVEVVLDAARACGLSLPPAVEVDPALRAELPGGYTASGGALQQLSRLLAGYGFEASIEGGRLQVLRAGATRPGEAVLLRDDDLIQGTTINSRGRLACKVPLDPRILPSALLRVECSRARGTYRVVSLRHDGDTRSGPWQTAIEAVPWP